MTPFLKRLSQRRERDGGAHRTPAGEEVNAAFSALLGRPEQVLEVGCGAGVNGMVARRAGARVTGLERQRELWSRAVRLLDEALLVDPEDAAEVARALGDRTFDLILMPDVLESARDPASLVRAYLGFLAPEGRLIVSARNREAWPVKFGVELPELGYPPRANGASRFYDREELVSLLSSAGLEVLQTEASPVVLKSLKLLLSDSTFLSTPHGEKLRTGFRDFGAYQSYLSLIYPFEAGLAKRAPRRLALQHVVVARKKPRPGPLSLTVGMLTMDEEQSIARMVEEIRKAAPDARILCVDSSVNDRTPIIAEELGVRVLRQLPPRGHGPAMELLMYEAARESDALIYLDCDFTYAPSWIPVLRRILESGADVVNAARVRERPEAMPLANFLANRTFAACARAVSGLRVSDLHSGLRGYRSSLIRSFSFVGEGDALPVDTLLWPARSGYRVVEIPIDYQERVGASKLRKLAGTAWTFVRLGKTLAVGSRRPECYEVWPTAESDEAQ